MNWMRGRPRATVAATLATALLTVAWLAPASSAVRAGKSSARAAAPLGGVNIAGVSERSLPAEADRTIALAHQLHVRLVRLDVPWSVLEPRGPEVTNTHALAFTDRLVSDAAAVGIRVVATVGSTPCWASSAPASLLARCMPGLDSKAHAWPPRAASDYASYVAFLARRYGAQIAIEVWNEPDQSNEDYFAGPNKAARYAAVLRAAYPAIKAANPGVMVLGGSLVGSNGVFLRALYAAGIAGYYDALSVHFYNLTLASLRSIHEAQLANGDVKPLWLDEFGWTSCWPHQRIQQEQACVTTGTQAENLTNTFRAVAHTAYLAAAIVYKLTDSTHEDFGLMSALGRRKPAFTALARVLAAPVRAVARATLTLSRRSGRIVASGSGPVGDFMFLEAFQGSVLRYRVVFTMDRFDRYSITMPAVLGSHLRVRVYQYWSGPGRSAQKSI
jgi:hypothetical protein